MQGNPVLLAKTISSTVGAALDGGHITQEDVPLFAEEIIRQLAPMLGNGSGARKANGKAAPGRRATRKNARGSGRKRAGGQKPAVPIDKSITRNHIICLEDGRKMRTLTRHIKSKYDLSPDDYRQKWNLPADYPMAAPSLSKMRSKLSSRKRPGRKKKAA